MISKQRILLFLLMFGFEAFASGLGIGPQVGYYRSKDADEGKYMFGGALRLRLSPALGVEGAVNYRQEKYDNGNLTVKSWPLFVTGLLYPIPLIYGAAGAGWYYTTYDYKNPGGTNPINDQTTKEFGWHFGGGIELPLGSSTKLAGDIRYVFLDYEFKEIPGSKDLKFNFYMIEVGLFFGL
jgi:opacity protein-like surface antigen